MENHEKKKAAAFTTNEVLAYLRKADDTPLNVRNKIIMLFGIFSLGRMEEITYLNWEDVTEDEVNHAFNFVLKRCKTRGKETKEQRFFLPFTVYGYDVRSLIEKHRKNGDGCGRLWRRNNSEKELGRTTIAETPRVVAKFLKLQNAEKYTGHGLRATGATWMADHGATELELMQAGNWKNPNIAREYIRQSLASQRRRTQLISGEALQQEQKGDEHQATVSVAEQKEVPPTTTSVAMPTGEANMTETTHVPQPSLGDPGIFSSCNFTNCTFVMSWQPKI